jgi:hypothetical protein
MANKKTLIGFRFDDKAEDAVAEAEKMAAAMITEITDETEKNIRSLIATAISDGIPVYDAARTIVPLIGLTSAQGQAVLKYRETLIDNGLALTTVNDKVDSYAENLLNSRADNIARTEILDALNAGANEAWQQAQDDGLLSQEATKELILSDDACPICVDIADEGPIPIGDDWSEDGPPFHPQCRCTEAINTP